MLNLDLVYPATGQPVRVVGTPEAPEWVASDVCAALEIQEHRSVLRAIPEDEKGVQPVHSPGGSQTTLTVTEAGLYRLIFRSNKPGAEAFRRWVLHEVLPAIRRTGTYMTPAAPAPPGGAKALLAMVQQLVVIEDRQQQLAVAQADQGVRLARIEARAAAAAADLRALPPATIPAPQKSLRAALNERVRSWALRNDGRFQDAWRTLRKELKYRAAFDAEARARHSGRGWLDEVELAGLIPTLYAIACEILVDRKGDAPQAA